jgi:hypothetical protein
MSYESLNLPIPTDLSRQVGISDAGSPLSLSRQSSTASSPRVENPDQAMRRRLLTYKIYLEHEITFVDNEITALQCRTRGVNPQDDVILDELLDGLKIRYNTLVTRKGRVEDLLEVM